jgi:hypothetical protein
MPTLRQDKPGENRTIALSRLPKSHDTGVFEGRDDVLAELDSMWGDVLADRDGRARVVSLADVGGVETPTPDGRAACICT